MKATYMRAYTKRNPNTGKVSDVFVYSLAGTAEQIADYKKTQGDKLRHMDNDPSKPMLFFTTRFAGNGVDIVKTQKGQFIADLSVLKAQASLASQFGGNLGQALANAAAANFLSVGSSSAPVAAPVVEAADDLSKA